MRLVTVISAAIVVALAGPVFAQEQRDAKLTHLSWNFVDLVEAHLIQMTYPEPGLFQQSMGYVDKDGNGIRYRSVYSNIFLAPPRTRGGPGGAATEGAPAKGNGPRTAR